MIRIFLEAFSELTGVFGEGKGHIIVQEQAAEGITVRGLFDMLAAKYPEFDQMVFNAGAQKLTGNSVVVLNGLFLDVENGMETLVNDQDKFTFVPILGDG